MAVRSAAVLSNVYLPFSRLNSFWTFLLALELNFSIDLSFELY